MSKVIVFQGDSVTDCGRSRDLEIPKNTGLGTGYANMIAARILADNLGQDITIYNRGCSGHRVVDLYARWKMDTINLKPDVLSILIGVNDTWHEFANKNGVEVPRYDKFYRMLMDWTQEACPNTKIVLCEAFSLESDFITPEWKAEMAERSKVVKQIAEDYNCPFIPFQSILEEAAAKAGDPTLIARDGVHPTLIGHQIMTDAWLKYAGHLI